MLLSEAWGKMIHEKNQKQKISWHCLFKKGNCLLLPYISGSSLPMALIKSDYVLKIYQIGCAKIQHKSP